MAVLIYERAGELTVPFVVRRSDLADHAGQVALPGGGVKAGEDGWTAAAREVEEELGLPAADLQPLGAGHLVYTAVSNFSVMSFVAHLARPDPVLTPDRRELVGAIEVPLDRLVDETAWVEREGWPGRHFLWQELSIWGLTYRVLEDLLPIFREAAAGPAGAR